jgi:hypothetical protein
MVRRQSSAGNDTVDMGMEEEILSPSVQNAKEADIGAQVFRLASNFQKRLRYSPEQEVVEFDLVLEYECLQLMRQRENDVEITGR